MLLVVIPKLKS